MGVLLTVATLVAALQFFFRVRIERMQTQRAEKMLARSEAEFRHDLALERLQNQLQTYEKWGIFFTAFARSSVNVRPDEFRQFIGQSMIFQRDPALRFVGLVGGVDPSIYGGSSKGFVFRSNLSQLGNLPNGTVFADGEETTLLVRSIELPAELLPRLEGSRANKSLRLVMLIDIEGLLDVFSEPLPGITQLSIKMGSIEQPDRDLWTLQEFQFTRPGRGPVMNFEQDLSVAGLTWEMSWSERSEKKLAVSGPGPQELAALGVSIAALLILLRLAWVRRRAYTSSDQILQSLLQTPVPAWRVDAHGFVVDMNQQALSHIRRNKEEIIGLIRLRDLTSGPFIPLVGSALGLGPGEMVAFGPLQTTQQVTAATAAVAAAPQVQAMPVPAPAPAPMPAVTSTVPSKPQPKMQENPFRRTVVPEIHEIIDSFDLKVFKSLTGADPEVMDEARKLSLQSLPQQYLALCEIVAGGDARRIQIAAHTMKSNLALLGSKGGVDICLRIEQDQLDNVPLTTWLERLQPMLTKVLKELREANFRDEKPRVDDNPFKRREA